MGLGGKLPKLPNFGKQLNFDHLVPRGALRAARRLSVVAKTPQGCINQRGVVFSYRSEHSRRQLLGMGLHVALQGVQTRDSGQSNHARRGDLARARRSLNFGELRHVALRSIHTNRGYRRHRLDRERLEPRRDNLRRYLRGRELDLRDGWFRWRPHRFTRRDRRRASFSASTFRMAAAPRRAYTTSARNYR